MCFVTMIDSRAFLNRYAKYVVQRAKTFTSKFEEMKVIGQVRQGVMLK